NATSNRDLSITKQVQNMTSGGGLSNSVSANSGDRVHYQINFSTLGDTSQDNVTIRDSLPSQIFYVGGSVRLDGNSVSNESQFFNSGVNLGTLNSNSSHTASFDANVASNISGGATLTNTATVSSTQVFDHQATALVTVNSSSNRDLSITKQVQNMTSGGGLSNSVSTNSGDRLHFVINFNTTGSNSQDNVILNDSMPSQLQFIGGSLRMDGNSVSSESNFFNSGINLGTLNSNSSHTASFDAYAPNNSGNITLTNTAYVSSTQVTTRQATAQVIVNGNSSSADLFITKSVLDVTRGDGSYQDMITANAGDRVRFQLNVSTLGGTTQSNVIVRDILPSQLTYVTGTENASGSYINNEYDLFGSGFNLGTIYSSTTKTIQFDAQVVNASSFSGTATIINTANVRSDQVSTRQDTATVNVQTVLGVTFQQRKTAYNLTQGADATTVLAHPGDVIAYTLYYKNTGSSTITNVTINDDLTGIKQYATVTNPGDAVSVNGSIVYAPVTVVAGVEVAKTFQVTIFPANQLATNTTLVMTNFFGNQVNVQIQTSRVQGAVTPPRTGGGEWLAGIFAALLTFGFWTYRKRQRRVKPAQSAN
ncbi:hypothetical protein D4R52_01250, partial [bacterium]